MIDHRRQALSWTLIDTAGTISELLRGVRLFMSVFIAIVGALLAIFSIIILHELGHFVVARVAGIQVLRFSIGFGKTLWKWVGKSGTEYVIALLPLGGYVKMLGEGQEKAQPENAHRAFNQKPLLTRMAVVMAGPFTNFLLAVVAYWGVYWMGITYVKPVVGQVVPHSIAAYAGIKPGDQVMQMDGRPTRNWQQVMMAIVMRMGDRDTLVMTVQPGKTNFTVQRELNLIHWTVDRRDPAFLESLGLVPYFPFVPPVIATVGRGSYAERGGLRPGDRVLSIHGKMVSDWSQMVQSLQRYPNQWVMLAILRDHQPQFLRVKIGVIKRGGQSVGYLGVGSVTPQWPSNMLYQERYSLWTAWVPAVQQAWQLTEFNALVLAKMIVGKVSLHTLGGPITVFQAAGKASLAGIQVYLGFLGFISLAIGFINVLPIPGLDGGHLFFQIIEGIFRRPVPERYQALGFSIGMIFLIFLMIQATVNDLVRLFL